jgi:hypothetical protein
MIRRLFCVAPVLILACAACGSKEDTATPLATPSVSVSRSRIPLGSPVDVTYKFQVAPSARFSKDYRVLVHFLDADDELMWTDDHHPPVPTSRWQPGQTIEYHRTMFVPLYPYIGDAIVTIGLYQPGSNERVPLSGETFGQREYRVLRVKLQPQTDNIFLAFLDGWHAPEVAADNQTVEWQWTRRDATIRFRNPKRDATFYLQYDGQPAMVPSPQTATIYLRDEVIDTFQIASTEQEIRRVALKAAQFGADEMVLLRISLDKIFVPALVKPGSRDSRELGIRVFHAFIEPH